MQFWKFHFRLEFTLSRSIYQRKPTETQREDIRIDNMIAKLGVITITMFKFMVASRWSYIKIVTVPEGHG